MTSPHRAAGRSRPRTRAVALLAALIAALTTLTACGLIDNGPEPPESLRQAATDPAWAAKEIAQLPPRTKGDPTSGFFYRPGTPRRAVASGEDEDAYRYANAILKGSKQFNPQGKPGPFAAARHVEVKAAAYMRRFKLSYAVLVINNAEGVCGEDTAQGCTTAVPVVLSEGYRLMVWWPDTSGSAQGPRPLDGKADS